jgi:hypothetical protein
MPSQTRLRIARILIPLAVMLGVVAVFLHLWLSLAAMVLLVAGQAWNVRQIRQGNGP